jgi:hypothetical protein
MNERAKLISEYGGVSKVSVPTIPPPASNFLIELSFRFSADARGSYRVSFNVVGFHKLTNASHRRYLSAGGSEVTTY